MQYQVLYSEGGVFDQELTPEGQFVGELIKRKVSPSSSSDETLSYQHRLPKCKPWNYTT